MAWRCRSKARFGREALSTWPCSPTSIRRKAAHFYGPDREPTTSLPFALWHVSGLDNYSIPHPMFVKKSDYAKAHGIVQKRS